MRALRSVAAARAVAHRAAAYEVDSSSRGGSTIEVLEKESTQPCSPEVERAKQTSAVLKINAGHYKDVSVKDVEELFRCVSGGSERLAWEQLIELLKTGLEIPCTDRELTFFSQYTDSGPRSTITATDFHRVLRESGVANQMMSQRRNSLISENFAKLQGQREPEVTRLLLVEKLAWRVNRDDAFCTLPFTMIYILVFIGWVSTHLHLERRFNVESALEKWMLEFTAAEGPEFSDVIRPQQTWEWVRTKGLGAVFSDCDGNETLCWLGQTTVFLGDVHLLRSRRGGSQDSQWLLASPEARALLQMQPGHLLAASTARLGMLQAQNWLGRGTVDFHMKFTTYNEEEEMFALIDVSITWEDSGVAVHKTKVTAAMVNPYRDRWIWIFDAAFIAMICFPLRTELKQLISSCKVQGCRVGLVSYWNFWNCVDWLTILFSTVVAVLWMACYISMTTDNIRKVLRSGPEGTLNSGDLGILEVDLQNIVQWLNTLHLVLFWLLALTMVKFWKAFGANRRLQLVTSTLFRAWTDIFHFGVVFVVIFLFFATCGHLLFGSDFPEFKTMGASINTAFMTLAGDFTFYVVAFERHESVLPSSGLPRWLLGFWFWVYVIFVVLIVLNMLLAIVLEHYIELVEEMRLATDAPTLWRQTMNFFTRWRQSKGFIPNLHLLYELQDADDPAHMEEIVTHESLQRCFPGMTLTQADFIMSWLTKEAASRQKARRSDEVINRLVKLEGMIDSMREQVLDVGVSIAVCNRRIQKLEEQHLIGHHAV
mmetsp:Transcript_43641/g.100950  ORF Transcript_43641/g.100950 Transcript_43641/m.100950 type:complete len:767 (+) Transcript_43641:51-2351(+)